MSVGISYILKTSARSRKLTIRVDTNGQVIVTAPNSVPKYKISQFVESAKDWIGKQQAARSQKPSLLTARSCLYFGKEYAVKVSKAFDGSVKVGKDVIVVAPLPTIPHSLSPMRSGVGFTPRNLGEVLSPSPSPSRRGVGLAPRSLARQSKLQRSQGKMGGGVPELYNHNNLAKDTLLLLSTWLKSRAVEYITKRVYEWSDQMDLPFRGLAFKQQKTRWGSCSSQKNLNFNWKLIHAPKEVIDYVIIHELAHTKEMNHGKKFWDLVARFDPDHAHHRRWLSRYGSTED